MSGDIFAAPAGGPRGRTHLGFAGAFPGSAQNEGAVTLVPRGPELQKIVDRINAERDIEQARREMEMNTPENRQKAFEAEMAERERKKIDFHCCRAMPNSLGEGWKHLREDFVHEEIRVYTYDYKRRRFWGIKPAGIGMYDFWEQIDPEVGRYDDNIAMTWENPHVSPPVTTHRENTPEIWAGQGINPDLPPPEPPIAAAPPPNKAAGGPRRRQISPEVNSTHRVRKSTSLSPKIDNSTRKSLVDEDLAPLKRLRGRPAGKAKKASKNDTSLSKRPRGRPATKANIASKNDAALSKRPRGRPPVKAQPAANKKETLPSKRPRGRPSTKGKATERPSKQKKPPTVKGSRVTKPPQTVQRQAPSTHKMRTRGGGRAEFLQLP